MLDAFCISGDGDFLIGAYTLSKHFGIKLTTSPQLGGRAEGHLSVLSSMVPRKQRRLYARELSLSHESSFKSGRVALFTCFCGDLECGATTVSIVAQGDEIVWSEFGMEAPGAGEFSQSEYMARTGAFTFDRSAYLSALSAYR